MGSVDDNYDFLVDTLGFDSKWFNTLLSATHDRASTQLTEFVKMATSSGLTSESVVQLLNEKTDESDALNLCELLTSKTISDEQMKSILMSYIKNIGGCI